MLSHPNIKVLLKTDYKKVIGKILYDKLIFTGPIDSFFDYKFGKLPYRSINFNFETLNKKYFQSTGTINFPNDYDYTRITEFKYLSGQQHPFTTIVYEYPTNVGDPYYPVPRPENYQLYEKYVELSESTCPEVTFVGRLATYKYYNMDQVVAQALVTYRKLSTEKKDSVTTSDKNYGQTSRIPS